MHIFQQQTALAVGILRRNTTRPSRLATASVICVSLYSLFINRNEFILRIAHLQLFHSLQLMKTMAAFNSFYQIMIFRSRPYPYQIYADLVNRQNIRRCQYANVRNRRFCRGSTSTVAVYGHAPQYIEVHDMFAKIIYRCFG